VNPGPDEERAKRIMEQVPQEPIAADPSENDGVEDRPEDDDDNGPDPAPGVPIFVFRRPPLPTQPISQRVGGRAMARVSIVLLVTLCSIWPLTAGSVGAQTPTDLMKKGGDLKNLAGPVNLNSASLDELKKLPGIRDIDAKKIVAGRPFAQTSDLVDKKILSQSLYDKVKSLITVK
jgi:hypothetical protein